METIYIYTDGGCRGNPGLGGWAYVTLNVDFSKLYQDSGTIDETTNNEMELTAIYKSLSAILTKFGLGGSMISNVNVIDIRSDSAYAIGCIRDWGPNWIRQGIIDTKANSKLVKDICNLVNELTNVFQVQIQFTKVKGHSGDQWNDYVDGLLNACMDERSAVMYKTNLEPFDRVMTSDGRYGLVRAVHQNGCYLIFDVSDPNPVFMEFNKFIKI